MICSALVAVAHLYTVHVGASLRDLTPGAGVECRREVASAAVGVYNNSYGRASLYAVAGFEPFAVGPVALGGVIGAATGYEGHHEPPIIGGLRVRYARERFEFGALIMPPSEEVDGAIHFTFGFRLR